MKNTQKNRTINKLLRDGYVTRNEDLRVFISRLGAIIWELEQEGWEFETKRNGTDYMYTVIKCPLTKQVYTLPTGKQIITYAK